MKITPLEIKQQKFEKSFRGFDPSEVQSFLNVVSNEWEHLATRNRELEQKIEELQDKIEHFERVEESLHETLETAKNTADTKLEGARKEAEHTIEKAEMEADSIIKDAEVEREKVRQSIRQLLNRRKEIIGSLQSYLNVAIESVNNFDEDEAGQFYFDEKTDNEKDRPVQAFPKDSREQSDEQQASKILGNQNLDELVDGLE